MKSRNACNYSPEKFQFLFAFCLKEEKRENKGMRGRNKKRKQARKHEIKSGKQEKDIWLHGNFTQSSVSQNMCTATWREGGTDSTCQTLRKRKQDRGRRVRARLAERHRWKNPYVCHLCSITLHLCCFHSVLSRHSSGSLPVSNVLLWCSKQTVTAQN